MHANREELTEVRERQQKDVEQSHRSEYGCGVERMIDSIDYERDDAGEDR